MSATVALAVLALATESARAPQSRATPSAQEIVARNHAATGGNRGQRADREIWLARSDGLTGTLEVVHRGADRAATLTLGPFRTERGVAAGRRWHQNDNGETVVDAEPEPSDRVVSESVARVHEPASAWVVTSIYASGHVTRSFYDARTYYLMRTEKSANGHTTRTTYAQFRPDARGRTRATHFFGSDELPQTDFDFRLTREEPLPASATDVAIPPNRRALVEFPFGTGSVRLPARIVRGRIYVRLLVAGRGLDFLLDSGSSNITLDETVARELGLQAYGRTTQTVAGTFATQRVIVPAVRIGPLAMHDVVMRTGPIAQDEDPHTRVVGLLGFDFLAGLGLKIDYAAGTVDAVPPGTMVAPPGAYAFELGLSAQVPVAPVAVGRGAASGFIVDTGAEFDAVLFARYAREHTDPDLSLETTVGYGRGVGGEVAYRPLLLERLALGPLVFHDVRAALTLAPNALGTEAADGLIGAGILERFTIYLDLATSRLYVAPGSAPASGARKDVRRRNG